MALWSCSAVVIGSCGFMASLGPGPRWRSSQGLAQKLKEEYKHAVLKSRGYPVDPTTSKAIDEQVDALLEKGWWRRSLIMNHLSPYLPPSKWTRRT